MPPPNQTYARDHIESLDALRGVAILLVLWFHIPSESLPSISGQLVKIFRPGYFGVDIFFVLSGFLITRILLTDPPTYTSLRSFYIKRAFRIFPIYYLVVPISLYLDAASGGSVSAPTIASFALYFNNFTYIFSHAPEQLNHTWSLAVEEHFYLCWPLLVFAVAAKRMKFISLILIPSIAIFSTYAARMLISYSDIIAIDDREATISRFVYMSTSTRIISLSAGGALAYFEPSFRGTSSKGLRLFLALFLVGLATLIISPATAFFYELRTAGATAVSMSLVVGFIVMDMKVNRYKVIRLLGMVGVISYGLYLYHPIVFAMLGQNKDSTMIAIAGNLLVLAGVALLSYALIEKPARQYGRRLANRTT